MSSLGSDGFAAEALFGGDACGIERIGALQFMDRIACRAQSVIGDAWPEPGQSPIRAVGMWIARLDENLVDLLKAFAGLQRLQTNIAQLRMRPDFTLHIASSILNRRRLAVAISQRMLPAEPEAPSVSFKELYCRLFLANAKTGSETQQFKP
jgi:hypothetical protein